MIADKLELTQDFEFDRVHRVDTSATSPTIARCTFFRDMEKILKAKYKLKGSKLFVGEDFSFRVQEIRKKLLPAMKKARSEGKRANIVFDHLIIEGRKFYLGEGETLRRLNLFNQNTNQQQKKTHEGNLRAITAITVYVTS
ncbi:hypothetical protein ACOMHN_062344 [Nucella lapillus]